MKPASACITQARIDTSANSREQVKWSNRSCLLLLILDLVLKESN